MLIALDAGHGIYTAGKRCDKQIDPNETREWKLNSRICNYIEKYLSEYSGYSLFRVDDTTGETDIALSTRVKTANTKGADFYLSIHHNAGIKRGTGGGIMSFSYNTTDTVSVAWRDELYDALIKYTNLAGNRSDPKTTANYYVLRNTKMASVLLELGFMDSRTDVPIILADDFAQKCAKAIVEIIVKRGGLKKKSNTNTSTTQYYRVQVGAYKNKANAVNTKNTLINLGYSAIVKTEAGKDGITYYKVQIGAYKNKANAIKTQLSLKEAGYISIIKFS